ncbi:hypothetical protein MY4824_004010 [Beauveria thailandica]
MPTVLTNGRFLRPAAEYNTSNAEFAQCLAINDENGTIQYIGPYEDAAIQELVSSGAQVHDMQERLIIPGLIDSHMHVLHTGESLDQLDLKNCKDLEEIRDSIRKYARAHPDVPRLSCRSWFQASTNNKALASTLDDLDPRPIYITAFDVHSMWCNTAALDELQVADMEDPPGGKIHRDEHGRPSGLLSESAALGLAMPFLSKQHTEEQKLQFVHDAFVAYAKSGYTGLVEMAMDNATLDILVKYRASRDGSLPIWMAMHWFIAPTRSAEDNLKQVERAIELGSKFNATDTPDCRIAGIKLMCDGVVDSCTASLVEPYSHTGQNEPTMWTLDELRPVLKRADDAGLQIAIHAIGDAAIKLALDGLEAVSNPTGRHRIEHLETCAPEDVPRLGKLGITASVQPVHSDPFNLTAWPDLIGAKRCGHVFPYNGFAEHGAVVALGTDAPTASHEPLPNLYTATTRKSGHKPEMTEATTPQFALSLAAATAAYTQGAAYSCFADAHVGKLEVGKLANLTVLDAAWEPTQLLQGSVVETWCRGQKLLLK